MISPGTKVRINQCSRAGNRNQCDYGDYWGEDVVVSGYQEGAPGNFLYAVHSSSGSTGFHFYERDLQVIEEKKSVPEKEQEDKSALRKISEIFAK